MGFFACQNKQFIAEIFYANICSEWLKITKKCDIIISYV